MPAGGSRRFGSALRAEERVRSRAVETPVDLRETLIQLCLSSMKTFNPGEGGDPGEGGSDPWEHSPTPSLVFHFSLTFLWKAKSSNVLICPVLWDRCSLLLSRGKFQGVSKVLKLNTVLLIFKRRH